MFDSRLESDCVVNRPCVRARKGNSLVLLLVAGGSPCAGFANAFAPAGNAEFRQAVAEYLRDGDGATSRYGSISSWSVALVTDMSLTFSEASHFDEPLDSWNTAQVTDMSMMFKKASTFNNPLHSWTTGHVTDMRGMFEEAASFNQPLDSWNTGEVIDMSGIFEEATSFNQPLDSWNTGQVTSMSVMFEEARSFNQPLDSWNTWKVTDMTGMFQLASNFNQQIRYWNVMQVNQFDHMFRASLSSDCAKLHTHATFSRNPSWTDAGWATRRCSSCDTSSACPRQFPACHDGLCRPRRFGFAMVLQTANLHGRMERVGLSRCAEMCHNDVACLGFSYGGTSLPCKLFDSSPKFEYHTMYDTYFKETCDKFVCPGDAVHKRGAANITLDGINSCCTCQINMIVDPSAGEELKCIFCDQGMAPSNLQTNCDYCQRGRYATTGMPACQECKVGHVAERGAHQCDPCPTGKVANSMQSECEVCSAGHVPTLDKVRCERCRNDSVAKPGALHCSRCPFGKVPSPNGDLCEAVHCAFFYKPSGSLDGICSLNINVVSVVVASFLLAMVLFLVLCVRFFKIKRDRFIGMVLQKMRNKDKIEASLKAINTLDFPMVIIQANTFRQMECLTPHEIARERNSLLFLDTVADVTDFVNTSGRKIVFISHQWLSFTEPDPGNTHYKSMVWALDSKMDRFDWSWCDVHVWVDYTSIPQSVRYTQKGAISSLPIYASLASAFVIVAPQATHFDLDSECNLHTYANRTWCRVECLSHYCHRGLDTMSISSDTTLAPVSEDWLQDVLLIFEGECTCCRMKHKDTPNCDKELLVTPALALYTHVLMEQHRSSASRHVYHVIERQKSRMFPKTLTAEFTAVMNDCEAIRRLSLGTQSTLVKHFDQTLSRIWSKRTHQLSDGVKVEERVLFGSLLDDLEAEISKNRANIPAPPSRSLSFASCKTHDRRVESDITSLSMSFESDDSRNLPLKSGLEP